MIRDNEANNIDRMAKTEEDPEHQSTDLNVHEAARQAPSRAVQFVHFVQRATTKAFRAWQAKALDSTLAFLGATAIVCSSARCERPGACSCCK